MRRIAISGSHGVGKSRLAEQLSELLLLPRIDEVARSVAKGWFADSEAIRSASPGQKLLFQLCVFHSQIHEETKLQEFVSDRSVFDAVAYSIYYRIPRKITDSLTEEAVKHSKGYDLIIYCPIPEDGGVPTADGFRFTDGESQTEVDRILQDLLKKAECEVLRLGPYRKTWLSEAVTFINCRRKGIRIDTAPPAPCGRRRTTR